jgi:hypothetical protein
MLGATSLTVASPALAGDGLIVSGTSRLRYEAIAGQARAGFNDGDTLVNLRTTIAADYHNGPVQLFGELWDSRVWGADTGTPVTTNEVNTIEPVQAFVGLDLGTTLGKGSRLRVQGGRFLLNLGSRRLVAADDYRNTTNGYTGIRVDLGVGKLWDASLIYVLPQQRLPEDAASLRAGDVKLDRESFDLVLWGGTIAGKQAFAGTMIELSYFHLGERDAPGRATRDRSLNTYGGRIMRDPGPGRFDFELEAFHQSGQISASLAAGAAVQAVAAGFVHADVGYTWKTKWQLRLSAELDWATGDRAGGSYNRFDTLFGMRRADLAPAGLYNSLGRSNLLTGGIRVEATPSKRFDVFAVYRALWLDARTDAFSTTGVRDATGNAGRFAGHQIEARMRWWVVPKRLRFEVDALWLAKGRFLNLAPNAPRNGDTRYGSLNLTASL